LVSLGLVSKLVKTDKADKADKAVSHSVKVVSKVAMPRASFLEKVKESLEEKAADSEPMRGLLIEAAREVESQQGRSKNPMR